MADQPVVCSVLIDPGEAGVQGEGTLGTFNQTAAAAIKPLRLAWRGWTVRGLVGIGGEGAPVNGPGHGADCRQQLVPVGGLGRYLKR